MRHDLAPFGLNSAPLGLCRTNRGNCIMGDQGGSEATSQPLAPSDFAMVMAKSRDNRLAFATWLIFFRDHGRFPRGPSDLEAVNVAALARQIEVTVPADAGLLPAERTAKRLRTEIGPRFGFREARVTDAEMLTDWLRDHVAAEAGGQIEPLIERLEARCRELAIEPPTADRVERIARTALHANEERFHAGIYARLSPPIRADLDELLGSVESENVTGSAPTARITWLAAFVYVRARILTDDLVDVLIETIHHIGARAERKVERELLADLKRVGGKQNLLFELADATSRAEALLTNERENMDLTSIVAIAQVDLGEALLASDQLDAARTAQQRADTLLAAALAHGTSYRARLKPPCATRWKLSIQHDPPDQRAHPG